MNHICIYIISVRIIKDIKGKTAFAAIISCACMLLASCGHHSAPPAEAREVDPAFSQTLARLQGSWISNDYIKSLRVTHSPFRSAEYIDAVFSFIIDSNKMHHDTLYFNALVRGQEENLWIVFGKRDSTGCYKIGQKKSVDYEADARSSPGDNVSRIRLDSPFVTIYTVASDSMRFICYDRVYKGRATDFMLRYYTTQALFDGPYVTADSDKIFGTSHIVFDHGHLGKIIGSPVYDSFDINVDLLGQSDSADYMEFFDTKGAAESHSYTYKIKGNTIKIYPLGNGQPCLLVQDTSATVLE